MASWKFSAACGENSTKQVKIIAPEAKLNALANWTGLHNRTKRVQ
jgi:hypothetical protein